MAKLINIKAISKKQTVYDFTVKKNYNFVVNGVVVHNCAEVSLSSYECCNLSELYLNNITSKEEMIRCALLLYKTQKAIAAMPFIHEETNKIVHKNMRLGLGITGICQSMDKLDWLDDCYKALRAFDVEWSAKNNWPRSIKLTVVKPSGCGSHDTVLKTSLGNKTYAEIFEHFGSSLDGLENVNGVWFDLLNNPQKLNVFDMNNEEKAITKLFINGTVDVITFETEDGKTHKFTPDHKFLVKRNNITEWVHVKDLIENDDIVSW